MGVARFEERSESQGMTTRSSLLAHHFRDGVPNDRAGFLDLFLRQADGDTHLQRGWDDLLRLEVVFQGLETGDEDSVGQRLHGQTESAGCFAVQGDRLE